MEQSIMIYNSYIISLNKFNNSLFIDAKIIINENKLNLDNFTTSNNLYFHYVNPIYHNRKQIYGFDII
jgi:hypothetical protein